MPHPTKQVGAPDASRHRSPDSATARYESRLALLETWKPVETAIRAERCRIVADARLRNFADLLASHTDLAHVRGLQPAQAQVLLAVVAGVDANGTTDWPIEAIAARAGMIGAEVRRHIDRLVAEDWIKRINDASNARGCQHRVHAASDEVASFFPRAVPMPAYLLAAERAVGSRVPVIMPSPLFNAHVIALSRLGFKVTIDRDRSVAIANPTA